LSQQRRRWGLGPPERTRWYRYKQQGRERFDCADWEIQKQKNGREKKARGNAFPEHARPVSWHIKEAIQQLPKTRD